MEHARQELHQHQIGALLLLDVDRFKVVNDTYGHPGGDALLTQLAEVLAQHGTAGRLGGDEFAIWLTHPATPPLQMAHDILTQTTHAFAWTHQANQPLSTGVSIGIATAPNDATDLATLFELADAALYQAKRAGGHQPRAATAKPTPAAPADVP